MFPDISNSSNNGSEVKIVEMFENQLTSETYETHSQWRQGLSLSRDTGSSVFE